MTNEVIKHSLYKFNENNNKILLWKAETFGLCFFLKKSKQFLTLILKERDSGETVRKGRKIKITEKHAEEFLKHVRLLY